MTHFDLDQSADGGHSLSLTRDLYVRREDEAASLMRAEHRRYVSIDFKALH